jgi:hypothetical protein
VQAATQYSQSTQAKFIIVVAGILHDECLPTGAILAERAGASP